MNTFRQTLWYFPQRLKFNSKKRKNTCTQTCKLTAPMPASVYLTMKECRGVRPGSWSSTGWGERSADRVNPEPSRSKVAWSGSNTAVSEVKVMERSWP